MSAQDNGGSAFPEVVTEYHGSNGDYSQDVHSIGGMTLRDYFAAKALCGIEASQGNGGHFVSTPEKVAARAYELADAMLKARQP